MHEQLPVAVIGAGPSGSRPRPTFSRAVEPVAFEAGDGVGASVRERGMSVSSAVADDIDPTAAGR